LLDNLLEALAQTLNSSNELLVFFCLFEESHRLK
jgi:hypothetical protein